MSTYFDYPNDQNRQFKYKMDSLSIQEIEEMNHSTDEVPLHCIALHCIAQHNTYMRNRAE